MLISIYNNRGLAYCQKSDDVPEKAISEDYNTAIENFNPDDVNCILTIGAVLTLRKA